MMYVCFVDQSEGDRYKKRPAYSYMQLITMAISSSPQQRMTLREIYQWIESQFPYYRQDIHQGWKVLLLSAVDAIDVYLCCVIVALFMIL